MKTTEFIAIIISILSLAVAFSSLILFTPQKIVTVDLLKLIQEKFKQQNFLFL